MDLWENIQSIHHGMLDTIGVFYERQIIRNIRKICKK
jgi:hypothetical protein